MERFTADDGVGIAYQVWGDGPGRPVVLHHGFIANSTLNWEGPGIAGLLAAGRRVVGIDARGHGASDTPHDPARYGEERMSRDLLALVELLGIERFDLVGYSMGAVVALIAASTDPRVARLVVGGVGEGIVERGGVDTRAIPQDALLDALRTDDPAGITDPQAAAFRAFADAVGGDRRALAAQVQALHATPIALERITAPTLVLAGDADALARSPERLAAAIPGARAETHAGDHLGVLRTPTFQRSLAAFLA